MCHWAPSKSTAVASLHQVANASAEICTCAKSSADRGISSSFCFSLRQRSRRQGGLSIILQFSFSSKCSKCKSSGFLASLVSITIEIELTFNGVKFRLVFRLTLSISRKSFLSVGTSPLYQPSRSSPSHRNSIVTRPDSDSDHDLGISNESPHRLIPQRTCQTQNIALTPLLFPSHISNVSLSLH